MTPINYCCGEKPIVWRCDCQKMYCGCDVEKIECRVCERIIYGSDEENIIAWNNGENDE